MAGIHELLDRFDKVSGKHPKWKAVCPAHEDRSPSLSIAQTDDGTILLHCFAGCGAGDVMAAIGLSLSDLFPDKDGKKDWRKERDEGNSLQEQNRRLFIREVQLTAENEILKRKLASRGKKNV
jgi:DNA primase